MGGVRLRFGFWTGHTIVDKLELVLEERKNAGNCAGGGIAVDDTDFCKGEGGYKGRPNDSRTILLRFMYMDNRGDVGHKGGYLPYWNRQSIDPYDARTQRA